MKLSTIIYLVVIIIGFVKMIASRKANNEKETKQQEVHQPVMDVARKAQAQVSSSRQNEGTTYSTTSTLRNNSESKHSTQRMDQKDNKVPETVKVEKKPQTTMEYLNEKSKQEAKDKLMEKQRVDYQKRQEMGNKLIGERLYLGDQVPNGKMLRKCSYCGADNLVPFGTREKYLCYFCREII